MPSVSPSAPPSTTGLTRARGCSTRPPRNRSTRGKLVAQTFLERAASRFRIGTVSPTFLSPELGIHRGSLRQVENLRYSRQERLRCCARTIHLAQICVHLWFISRACSMASASLPASPFLRLASLQVIEDRCVRWNGPFVLSLQTLKQR